MHRSRSLLRPLHRPPHPSWRFSPPLSSSSSSPSSPHTPPPRSSTFGDSPSFLSSLRSHSCLLPRSHSPASDPSCLTLQRHHFLTFGDGDEDSGLRKEHEESRVIGYSPEQLYAVVAAVDLYQDFVPWCLKSTILRQNDSVLEAELEIGFKFLVERYVSHVELRRPSLIKTTVSKSNIFEYLTNVWEFKPGPIPGSCNLHFSVNFQFRSPLYRQVANMFFEEVVSRLVSSFEERCNTVYGPSVKVLEESQTA